jgi:dinuclear metal center YbgI/SA1388 family protein
MPALAPLAEFLDAELNIVAIPDYPNAVNGVQLANTGDIRRVATAVDFSSHTVTGAISAGAGLLVVHHGMFWGGVQAITGSRRRRLHALLTHDVAVYSAHLPLDVHPTFGNNALLVKRLGLEASGGFAKYQTIDVGLSGTCDIPTQILASRAQELAREYRGTLVATPFDADRISRRWGVCTGAGADSATVREASERGLDTLIVGEGPHHTAVEARELDIVILYVGHYASETLGVRALGEALATQFDMTSTFVDAPTGL